MKLKQYKFQVLWKQQDGLCWLCDKPMLSPLGRKKKSASFDHVIPTSRGGSEGLIENLRLAHVGCNNKRASPSLVDMQAEGLTVPTEGIVAAFKQQWKAMQA